MSDHMFVSQDRPVKGWKRFRDWLGDKLRATPVQPLVYHVPQPTPREPEPEPPEIPTYEINMDFRLPSRLYGMKFRCRLTINYRILAELGEPIDPESLVTTYVQQKASAISSELSLTDNEELSFNLNGTLGRIHELPESGLEVWARCSVVHVESDDLQLVREMERAEHRHHLEKLQESQLDRQVNRLYGILQDPKVASVWWLAQHPDQLERLPEKAQLFQGFDSQFRRPFPAYEDVGIGDDDVSPEVEDEDSTGDSITDSDVLQEFLDHCDEGGKTAVRITLENLYREHGRDDLADQFSRFAGAGTAGFNDDEQVPMDESGPPLNPDSGGNGTYGHDGYSDGFVSEGPNPF